MLLRNLLKKKLKKLKPRKSKMEVVIPLAIIFLIVCLATKRFAPDNWDIMVSNVKRIVSKFKK